VLNATEPLIRLDAPEALTDIAYTFDGTSVHIVGLGETGGAVYTFELAPGTGTFMPARRVASPGGGTIETIGPACRPGSGPCVRDRFTVCERTDAGGFVARLCDLDMSCPAGASVPVAGCRGVLGAPDGVACTVEQLTDSSPDSFVFACISVDPAVGLLRFDNTWNEHSELAIPGITGLSCAASGACLVSAGDSVRALRFTARGGVRPTGEPLPIEGGVDPAAPLVAARMQDGTTVFSFPSNGGVIYDLELDGRDELRIMSERDPHGECASPRPVAILDGAGEDGQAARVDVCADGATRTVPAPFNRPSPPCDLPPLSELEASLFSTFHDVCPNDIADILIPLEPDDTVPHQFLIEFGTRDPSHLRLDVLPGFVSEIVPAPDADSFATARVVVTPSFDERGQLLPASVRITRERPALRHELSLPVRMVVVAPVAPAPDANEPNDSPDTATMIDLFDAADPRVTDGFFTQPVSTATDDFDYWQMLRSTVQCDVSGLSFGLDLGLGEDAAATAIVHRLPGVGPSRYATASPAQTLLYRMQCVMGPTDPAGESVCNDGEDNDNDAAIDCEDDDCAGDPSCPSGRREYCANGIDDDGDAMVDCADPSCRTFAGCAGRSISRDCSLDPGFTSADCRRLECALGTPDCSGGPGVEICTNGVDDDGDRLADCTDPDCVGDPTCASGCPSDALGPVSTSNAGAGLVRFPPPSAPPGSGFVRGGLTLGDDDDATVQFVTCDSADVSWNISSGAFGATATIDGGGSVAIPAGGSGTVSASSLSAGVHTLALARTDGPCGTITAQLDTSHDGGNFYADATRPFSAAPEFAYRFTLNPYQPHHVSINPPGAGEAACELVVDVTVDPSFSATDFTGRFGNGSSGQILPSGGGVVAEDRGVDATERRLRFTYPVADAGGAPVTFELAYAGSLAGASTLACSTFTIAYDYVCPSPPTCAVGGVPPHGYVDSIFGAMSSRFSSVMCFYDTCGNPLNPQGSLRDERRESVGLSPDLRPPFVQRPWPIPSNIPVDVRSYNAADLMAVTGSYDCPTVAITHTTTRLTIPDLSTPATMPILLVDSSDMLHRFDVDCAPSAGVASVRVINVAPLVPTVSVSFEPSAAMSTESAVALNVPYGSASPYVPLSDPSGDYLLGEWRYYSGGAISGTEFQYESFSWDSRLVTTAEFTAENACTGIIVWEDPSMSTAQSIALLENPPVCQQWRNRSSGPHLWSATTGCVFP